MRLWSGMALWAWGLLFLAGTGAVQAEVVREQTATGVGTHAEFLRGEPGRPALLILHGFLQTRDFHTVKSLGAGLHASGFSVLVPTLSLGVDRRERSLPCDALHLHDMESGAEEIRMWRQWLENRGFEDIVLVGHSSGSARLVHFLDRYPDASVRGAVLISLLGFRFEDFNVDTARRVSGTDGANAVPSASGALAAEDEAIAEYRLSYCERYPAPASKFLSYYEWNCARIARTLAELETTIHVILGGEDPRVGRDWPERLGAAGADVTLIDGASHFFDGMHEFDLLEVVEAQLSDWSE